MDTGDIAEGTSGFCCLSRGIVVCVVVCRTPLRCVLCFVVIWMQERDYVSGFDDIDDEVIMIVGYG